MSSCNLAKSFGFLKKMQQTWKVHILSKIDVSCLCCYIQTLSNID